MELRDLVRETRALGPGGLARGGTPYLLEEGRLRTDTRRMALDSTRRVSTEPTDEEREVTNDIARRRVFPVTPKPGHRSVTIGRTADCDIVIDLSSVSSRHATIEGGPEWTLRDLGSTNGTYLEGERLERDEPIALLSGSVVRFGPEVKLTFLHADAMENFLRQLDPVLRRGSDIGRVEEGAVLRRSDVLPAGLQLPDYLDDDTPAPPKKTGKEKALEPPAPLEPLSLACPPFPPIGLVEGVPVLIGRIAGNDLILPHPQVSRTHARVERHGDRVEFTDLKSANGIMLGEKKVERASIAAGEEVAIGPYRICVIQLEAAPPRAGGGRAGGGGAA